MENIRIEKLNKNDLDSLMSIWLNENIRAHYFIDPKVFKDYAKASLQEALLQSEVYVAKSNEDIVGFIGLNDTYIEGLFISGQYQRSAVGTYLMDFVKSIKDKLTLRVFQSNRQAVMFYLKSGFMIKESHLDSMFNVNEYVMIWKK